MSDRIPMTRTGYNKIKAELDVLQNEHMPEIEKRIAAARAEGDLSENAEYHGARETQGMILAKINLLKDKLVRASIVDTSKVPKDRVAFGCTVVVKDLDFDDALFRFDEGHHIAALDRVPGGNTPVDEYAGFHIGAQGGHAELTHDPSPLDAPPREFLEPEESPRLPNV